MPSEFLHLLRELTVDVQGKAAPPGRKLSIKDLFGDIHNRFNSAVNATGIARPPSSSDARAWVQKLKDAKHWGSKERILSQDQITHLDQLLAAHEKDDGSSQIKLIYPKRAEHILVGHFGSSDFSRSADDMLAAMLDHPRSPHMLRGQGQGVEALNLFRCFLAMMMSKKFAQKFGTARIQVDAALLGAMSWTIYQYGNVATDLPILRGLIDRNADDPFFIQYLLFIWKRYMNPTGHDIVDHFRYMQSGATTRVRSYGSGVLLNASIYNNLGQFARENGASPFDKDSKFLADHSPVELFDIAIRMNEAYTDVCVFAFEDMAINLIAKANLLLNHSMTDKAAPVLEEAEKSLNVGGFEYRRASLFEAWGDLYELTSDGTFKHADFARSQEARRAAAALYDQLGLSESAASVRRKIY